MQVQRQWHGDTEITGRYEMLMLGMERALGEKGKGHKERREACVSNEEVL